MDAIRIITLNPIFSLDIEVRSFFVGFKNIQETIARMFKVAAKMKNELPVPVFSVKKGMVIFDRKNGNITALAAEPVLPNIFIVPDTTPEQPPPISIQNVELGATVISVPNTAIPKQIMNTDAEMLVIRVQKISTAAARVNPTIAGIFLMRSDIPYDIRM
jgi:hypothetical protein